MTYVCPHCRRRWEAGQGAAGLSPEPRCGGCGRQLVAKRGTLRSTHPTRDMPRRPVDLGDYRLSPYLLRRHGGHAGAE